jgi:transcriptional regulator with XRE-family HTH domain
MEAQVMSESSERPDYLKIKAARKASNWTQQDLADKAGYALSVIQKVETGKYDGLACLETCVKALGKAYDEVRPDPQVPDATASRVREPVCELHALDDDGRVGKLTKRYYYKIKNATLTIRGTEAHLIIAKVTVYDHPSRSEKVKVSSHRLEGDGQFVDGTASILYRVEDQKRGLSWAGVCVLNVPPAGKIHGYWMAAGVKERGRTVLGRLELDRKSLVRKSSEEAGGHDQREG